jgi:hypothetical protein
MASATAQFFKQRNSKTIYLKEVLDSEGNVIAIPCAEDDAEAQGFEIRRVNGDQVGRESMQALLGEDEYVRFANWYTGQSSADLASARASKAKMDDPKPWSDTPPETSETYTAHMLALSKVMRRSVLRAGMKKPSYAEAGEDLGPFEDAVHVAIRTFGRTLVTTDPKS